LGNAKNKFDTYPYTQSIVITGNEIKDYFRVVLAALKEIFPDLAAKTKHLPHGMLRLTTGKMSSRTGDVITAESLIEEVKDKVKGDEAVAIGAVKYMILRSNIGSDIVFDIDKSVSTEGDSGVYLQYAHARANSVLEKAGKKGDTSGEQGEVRTVEKLLYRFPEVVLRSQEEYAPHHMITYLTELSSAFNNFYAHEQVVSDESESPYRLAIVEAFTIVMKNGLTVLGIPAPERM
jgi:arginyl-tRNA synthetase